MVAKVDNLHQYYSAVNILEQDTNKSKRIFEVYGGLGVAKFAEETIKNLKESSELAEEMWLIAYMGSDSFKALDKLGVF